MTTNSYAARTDYLKMLDEINIATLKLVDEPTESRDEQLTGLVMAVRTTMGLAWEWLEVFDEKHETGINFDKVAPSWKMFASANLYCAQQIVVRLYSQLVVYGLIKPQNKSDNADKINP
jgi:hypothetical protein